ncbi:Interferon-induced GTP-binding protein Mx [Phytophthora cinnamomi]|uniref:Interferon-induced GTP-binding protein Mx n=1 Tax=Phytophthora cinnamomi TaxID=4785 RepID=UPI00355996A2|nr:Interferon-induced GTP-binding protein Mx [Phytophthora cinnamomi]
MKLKIPNFLLDQVRTSEHERKLIDELRDIGLDQYIELPQIAVMGDTSSGKSSLLSALSGVSFPSSDQLTTRCPTQLVLTRADTFHGTVRLVRFQSSTNGGNNDDGEEKEELRRLEDVPDAITKLTQKLVDEGQYISDDQIVIEMCGPDLPNLTLTDLPGLVRTVGDHEDQCIMPRVRQMVDRYMQQERTVIIAVVPANVDMHNTEILQAAQEADPNGTRTIAVVTKVDLVDAGAELAVHELLVNKKKRMHLGYHAVKCRSQRELTKGTTIEKGVANELAFFGQHEYWRKLPTQLWGVPRLSERLVSILQDNIRRSLPKVIAEISALITETQKALSTLGMPLESPGRGNVRVERFFKETTDRVLAMLKESAQRELELLLQHEARPYTQDQRLYDELDRLRQQELHARLEAALPAGDRHGLVSIATVIRALGDISMGPFGMSLDDREALEMEVALRAYLEVASHRFVDVVPMKLNGLLLESFVREMESELLGAATDEKVAELLQESDSQALRRHQLLRELGTLEEGKQILEKTEGLQG